MKTLLWVVIAVSCVLGGVGVVVAAEDVPAAGAVPASDGAAAAEVKTAKAVSDDELVLEEEKKDVLLGVDFVLNVRPASLLVNADGDDFRVNGARLSTVYMMPNISMGVGMEFARLYAELTAGAGLLLNDQFRSFMLEGSLAVSFEVSDSLYVGPRAGVILFPEPDWIGDGECEFDGATGFLVGLQFYLGDKISYLVNIDLVFAEFDATPAQDRDGQQTTLDVDTLDMVGLAVQFGVRGQF